MRGRAKPNGFGMCTRADSITGRSERRGADTRKEGPAIARPDVSLGRSGLLPRLEDVRLSAAMPSDDSELIAQQVSGLNRKVAELEKRVSESEKVNARLEQAALITARALQEVSGHWDAVYEAMRREEGNAVDQLRDGSDETPDEIDFASPS